MNDFIGVFDSGFGGLSTLRRLRIDLPDENFIYIGDSANAPYGTRPNSEILSLSQSIGDYFVNNGAKAIVIACNTVSTTSAKAFRSRYNIPIIAIEPAIKPAILENEGKNICVFATNATLNSELFQKTRSTYGHLANVIEIATPEFVDIVENENFTVKESAFIQSEVDAVLAKYLSPKQATEISAIVLGCTHFKFLEKYIKNYFKAHNADVTLYNGNRGVAMQLKNLLTKSDLLNKSDEKGKLILINSKGDEYVRKMEELLCLKQ